MLREEALYSAMSIKLEGARQQLGDPESYLSKLYLRNNPTSATIKEHKIGYDAQVNEQDRAGKSAVSLLLRLVNETFLSLPILDCRNGQPSTAGVVENSLNSLDTDKFTLDNEGIQLEQQSVYDACFVDWAQAKLVQNPTTISSNKLRQNDNNEFLLANLLDPTKNQTNFLAHHDNHILSTFKHLDSHQQASNKSYFDHSLADYEFVKLTYLSISTILSICGLLINLFIILIIIFDTKQKHGSSLIRSNGANKNNALLFQLTFTGLLLTSYVLLENISIQSTSTKNELYPLENTKSTLPFNNERELGINHILLGLDASLCSSFVVQFPPPLSTFLPPTPFEYEKLICSMPLYKPPSDCKTKITPEDGKIDFSGTSSSMNLKLDQEHLQQSPALILEFDTRILSKIDNHGELVEGDNKLENSHSNYIQLNNSKFIRLGSSLRSVSIASSSCQMISAKDKSTAHVNHRKVRSQQHNSQLIGEKSTPINPNQTMKLSPFDPNGDSFIDLGVYLSSAIPLMINVIAAVHMWTIAALAYDRYCAIAYPLQYLRSIHSSRTRTFILLSWTASLVLNLFIPISFNQISSNYDQNPPKSQKNQINSPLGELYTWSNNKGLDLSESNMIQTDNSQVFRSNKNGRSCHFLTKTSDETLAINSKLGASYFLNQLDNFWSTSTVSGRTNTIMDTRKIYLRQDFIGKLAILLIETSKKIYPPNVADSIGSQTIQKESINGKFYTALLLIFSFFNFMIIILIPLIIIAICSICIYRIVKVHERRISFSSGTNATAPMETRNFQRQNANSDNVEDCRSEAGSITSLLIATLSKIGLIRASSRHDLSFTSDQEANHISPTKQSAKSTFQNPKYMSHDKSDQPSGTKRNINSNIVNRSKRLIVRQDSYQILNKLNGGDSSSLNKLTIEDSPSKMVRYPSNEQVSSSCNSILFSNHQTRRGQVKRKISDHTISSSVPRRDSTTSQVDDSSNQNNRKYVENCDTCSYTELPSTSNLDHFRYDSGGIINQLKLAGLSFAGVAIQEPLFGMYQHRPLKKSSSCSLGNLHNNQHYNQAFNPSSSPMSRCSIETSSTFTCPKKSHSSLNNSLKIHDNKCTTKLLDIDADNFHKQSLAGGHSNNLGLNFHQSHSRLPFTIGTKSAPFNVVIWLILTMLLFTLPHYFLVTVNHIMKFNSANNLDLYMASVKQLDSAIYERQLLALIKMIAAAKPTTDSLTGTTDERPEIPPSFKNSSSDIFQFSLLQMTSIWLACLFRVLFLTMVPINGWLYGIRSRSIRAKLRMVLKHYISRRQASIEITHRQKSTSLRGSRDSSFTNFGPLCYNYNNNNISATTSNNNYLCTSCHQYNQPLDFKSRTFNRCSSLSKREVACFRLPAQISAMNSTAAPTATDTGMDRSLLVGGKEFAPLSQVTTGKLLISSSSSSNNNTSFNNSINNTKFLIGDYSTDRDSDNSSSLPPATPNLQYLSQNTSQSSSLNGSSRSLVSTTLNSQSTAILNCNYRLQDSLNRCQMKISNANQDHSNETNKILPSLAVKKDSIFEDSPPLITKTMDGDMSGQNNDNMLNYLYIEPINNNSNNIDDNLTGKLISNNLKTSRNYSCPDNLKQSHFLTNIQRRCSTTELIKSGTHFKTNTVVNEEFKLPIRRSSSEIRSFNQYVELNNHHPSDCNCTVRSIDQVLVSPESEIQTPKINSKSNSRIRTTRFLHSWWKHLKQNLTSLLINASANILAAKFIENGNQTRQHLVVKTSRTDMRYKRNSDFECAKDQCRIALLRRSSTDSPTSGWSENSLNSQTRSVDINMIVQIDNKKRNKLRNSFTLNNIEDLNPVEPTIAKCRCQNHHQVNLKHSESGYGDKPNHLGQSSVEQSPSYLKPPNFLKLVFEPNNHAAQYAGLSALSPIKEYSANHSYASSRTSLNTPVSSQVNNQQQQPTIRNLAMAEMNQVSDSRNSNVDRVIDRTNSNKIETILVKDASNYDDDAARASILGGQKELLKSNHLQ